MRVISRARLREFWRRHPDAEPWLAAWFRNAEKATWRDVQDVRKLYRHADGVRVDCSSGTLTATVFNVKGNKYRMITLIRYPAVVYIKDVLTHAEYDRYDWKGKLCRD